MKRYVIGSESEQGYWNNELGWVTEMRLATRFTAVERDRFSLPDTKGCDAEWVKLAPCTTVTCRLSCANDQGACLSGCRA